MLLIFGSLTLLFCLIFFQRFGVAEVAGNILLLLSIFIVVFQLFHLQQKDNSFKKNPFNFFLILFLIIFAILIFRATFLPGPAVWGDSPYFYPEAFKFFLSEPLSWESRGRLGVVNDLYFIYPLMFVYYVLGVIGFNNDLIIRLLFHLPTIFLAFISPWFFTRYFKFPPLVQIFSCFIYGLNTYFILLIDGGQVGVALAYGLFPLILWQLHKLIEGGLKQFAVSLISFFVLIIADVRFAIIALFTFLLWIILSRSFKIQYLRKLFFFVFCASILSLYWLIPALGIESTTGSGVRSDLKLISVLHPLTLFAPHWPLNEFGKISSPSWYFLGIPLLIFSNLFKRNWRSYFLIFNFLIFVFLAKGDTGFLGGVYRWFVESIPLAGAFRDSTKFFAPLLLYGGILIGLFTQNLSEKLSPKLVTPAVLIVFLYLFFLISPGMQMHGVLSGREMPKDLQIIADKISTEKDFLRTVWFPERHILSFHTEGKPALDAKSLVNLRPFASLNTGTGNAFNFLHESESIEWFKLLGIQYLVFSGDTKKVNPTEDDKKDWSNLLDLTATTSGLIKLDWGTTTPIYEVKDVIPRVFATNKLFAIIGGDDIFREVSPTQGAFVFFEDGKFKPQSLENIASDSAVLVFNDKNEIDLQMSFLQDFFLSSSSNEWATRGSKEYLKWRYELLVNGVETREFDFGKGVNFSTIGNEKITFKTKPGEYYLAVRYLSPAGSLNLELGNYKKDLEKTESFRWFISELFEVNEDLVIKNSGFNIVNTVALVPKKDFEEAEKLTQSYLQKFKVFQKDDEDLFSLINENRFKEVRYEMISPVKYRVSENDYPWVIFTDSYNKSWMVNGQINSYPMYSIVNGFYVPNLTNFEIYFEGQKIVNTGVKLSIISLGILLVIAVIVKKRSIS